MQGSLGRVAIAVGVLSLMVLGSSSLSGGVYGIRELAYENSVSVGQGQWPVWVLPAEVHGSI